MEDIYLAVQGCMTDSHCLLENLQCLNFTCACTTGYRKYDSGNCLRSIYPNVTSIVKPTPSKSTDPVGKSHSQRNLLL